MNENIKQTALKIVNQCLPANSKLILLSLTGSQAFGWASDVQDYDVHGLFFSENYWDWVHVGREKCDINLYELNHVASDIQNQNFEQFMNWSNPIYIDNKFDYNTLMSYCTVEAVKRKQADIQAQINRFKFDKSPRSALHAYRIMMVPLYFMENAKFELNIFKINQKYNLIQLNNLKEAYNNNKTQVDTNKVIEEIAQLYKVYQQKLSSAPTNKPNTTKAIQWINNIKILYRSQQ